MSNVAQRSFASGELAPALYARTDQARYVTGLRTCRNMWVQRHGGATNRPGTELVGTLPGIAAVRLLPFVFNDDQAYVLEFTHQRLRFARLGGYIAVGAYPYELVTPYAVADLATLQITQSADVVTIVHPNYAPRELRRLADDSWTLSIITFGPTIAPPTGLSIDGTNTRAGIGFHTWAVTAVSDSGSESYPSNLVSVGALPITVGRRTLAWNAVAGAVEYRVYKSKDGGLALVGTVASALGATLSFVDNELTADPFNRPPVDRSLFNAAGEYPAAVSLTQQRLVFGGSTLAPETVWTSRTADYRDFGVSTPVNDNDAITFTLASKDVNRVVHLVDEDPPLLLTSGGEWVLRGDQAGILRPTDINAKRFSKHGASPLPPIVLDPIVLYVQARQSIVREIRPVGDRYTGADLTVFSAHLFDGFTLRDWAYQEVPNTTVWCVRSDGVLLGFTILDEQGVRAWHRHDTDGIIENVCVVPEGGEDRLYLVVRRNGVRMLERMASRAFAAIEDAVFTDSSLSYDGRNVSGGSMTILGGSQWDEQELLTLVGAGFAPDDVGNHIVFTPSDGLPLRFRIANYVSSGAVTGFVNRSVPLELQGAPVFAWSRAVDVVSGLDHLEGKSLAVVADGYVVASPNNPANPLTCVVSGGSITLDRPYSQIRAGLPYLSDLETLDIDSPQGSSLKDRKLLVNMVTLMLERSRGAFVGQSLPDDATPALNMNELKMRDEADDFGPIALLTGDQEVVLDAAWNSNGRIAIRNVDPLPLTVLAAIPRGILTPTG